MTGIVFDIQRSCIHDGPGLRTTVFLKGCNLRCQWCHNPECFSPLPQLQYRAARCISCGACVTVCPQDAHILADAHRVRFDLCRACGRCVQACPANALTLVGKRYTCEEVLTEIRRDAPYFAASGGGVTFSGGEPTMQTAFLSELLRQCRQCGYHTAIETNGLWPDGAAAQLLPFTDLILLDFKLPEAQSHAQYTGRSNAGWHDLLRRLNAAGKPVILRCPIIPSVNDHADFLSSVAAVYRQYPCIRHVELMSYHTIGVSKWAMLGLTYPLSSLPPLSMERKRELEARLHDLCGPWRDAEPSHPTNERSK